MAVRMSTHSMADLDAINGEQNGPVASFPSTLDVIPSPETVSAIIRRSSALVRRLLPIELEEESISGQEGIIDTNCVGSFSQVGGDFGDVVPYALLQSRAAFLKEAANNDFGLNSQRALACEVIARRVVARAQKRYIAGQTKGLEANELSLVKQFVRIEDNGSVSMPTSVLEAAVDQHCQIFLSSSSVQHTVNEVWTGRLVRKYAADGHCYFVTSAVAQSGSFLDHLHPSRLGVPRNRYYIEVILWLFYVAVFSVVMHKYDNRKYIDGWEVTLWVFSMGYLFEDLSRWIKLRGLDTMSLWTITDLLIDLLVTTAFGLRIASFVAAKHQQEMFHLRSYQLLCCVAPLLWLQLLKAFDCIKYFGSISIIVYRMLSETTTFSVLLLINAIGFSQALYALNQSDEPIHHVRAVVKVIANAMMQSIIGSVNFNYTEGAFGYPIGSILWYLYAFICRLILAPILVAFYSQAYGGVVRDADTIFAAYFASKVVSLSRAPDQFVYMPPSNLVEAFVIAPLEWVLPHRMFCQLNRFIMRVFFFVPLAIIAVYETRLDPSRKWGNIHLDSTVEEREREAGRAQGVHGTVEDPRLPASEINKQLSISRWTFDSLVKKLPDVQVEDKDTVLIGEEQAAVTALSSWEDAMVKLMELRTAKVSPDRVVKALKLAEEEHKASFKAGQK